MPHILYNPSTVSNPDVETPRFIPDDYQHIQSTPASFGGLQAQAAERAGGEINQGAGALYEGAIRGQEIVNTTNANTATGQYVDKMNSVLYGDGTPANPGLFNLKGDAALRALPGAIAAVKQTFNEVGGTLTSPVAQNMFDQQTRRYMMMHEDQLFRFGQEQQTVAAKASNDSMIATSHVNSGLSYNNDNIANADIDQTTHGLVQNYELEHGVGSATDNIKQSLRQQAITTNVNARVSAAMNKGDYTEAHRIFNGYSPYGDPEKLRALGENLDRAEYEKAHRGQTDLGHSIGDAIIDGRPIPGGGAPAPGSPAAYDAGGSRAEYIAYGKDVAAKYGIPWEVFSHQIAGESSWYPGVATSSAGAQGIAQFIPDTAAKYNVDVTDWKSSLDGAARYMVDLHQQGGTWQSALTGYLSGNPRDIELVKDVSSKNPEYALAYQAARAADRAGSGLAPAGETATPGPSGSTGPAGAAASSTIALGDSIAAGIAATGKYKQTVEQRDLPDAKGNTDILAASGRTTEQSLAVVQANPSRFAGQNIYLSGGLSNDLNSGLPLDKAIANTAQQITLLKQAGANVALMGVGTGVKNYQQANTQLAALAQKENIPFTGQLATTEGGRVHPHDYGAVVKQIPDDWTTQAVPSAADQQVAQASTGTMIDAGPAAAPASSTTVAPTVTSGSASQGSSPVIDDKPPTATPSAQQPPALAAMPSLESQLNKIPKNLTPEAYAAAESRIRQRYNQNLASIYEEHKKMEPWIQGGMALLADGKQFDYDPATIRHYLTPSEADKALDALDTAKDQGQWKTAIQTMNPTQIQTLQNKLEGDLSNSKPDQYPRAKRILDSLNLAVRSQTTQMLGGKTEDGKDVSADPAGYLRRIDPIIEAKQQALDFNNPASVDAYVNAVAGRQDMMGVPTGLQHVLSRTEAVQLAQNIATDPANAASTMQKMAAQWGSHWGNVFNDAVTMGKLPAPYQIVQHLEDINDPHNAALLARGLAGTGKEEKNFWENTLGEKTKKTIDDGILSNEKMGMFVHSLEMSGAPVDQMNSLIGAVHSLAYAKQAYEGDKISSDAATDAINAIIANHYSFLTEYGGNARVPTDVASTVRSNIDYYLNSLDHSNTTIPPLTNGVTPEQYLAAVKANPTWVTNRDDKGVHLVDKDGRDVLDVQGRRITVPFNAGRWNPATPRENYPTGGTL